MTQEAYLIDEVEAQVEPIVVYEDASAAPPGRAFNPGVKFVGGEGFAQDLDTVRPVVDNFSPASGATINGTDPIFFDVTDNSGLFRRVLISVDQDATELAHDGDNFLAPYATLSIRTTIAGGFQYKLRRDGGWTADATVRAFAIDQAGNENNL